MSEKRDTATHAEHEKLNKKLPAWMCVVKDKLTDAALACARFAKKAFVWAKTALSELSWSKIDVLIWIVLGLLIVLLIISSIVLTLRLTEYSKVDERVLSISSNMDETLDVFALEYKNDSGDVTIKGADGDKVLAPGAVVEYSIRIRNTDRVAIDYLLVPKVKFLSEIKLPIQVRLIGPNEEYIVGSATEWVDMEQLNSVERTETLVAGESIEYYFQWRWPFEAGNDDYDTWLGSNVDKLDIGAEMSFGVHATANTDVELNGGAFGYRTPDVTYIIIFIILLLAAITLLVIRIIKKMREKEPEPEVVTVTVPEPEPIPEPQPEPAPVVIPTALTGRMSIVNLEDLEAHFASGEEITLEAIKQKGLLPKKAKYLKVLGDIDHPLQKAWVVRTHRISEPAKAAILKAGGEVHIIKE